MGKRILSLLLFAFALMAESSVQYYPVNTLDLDTGEQTDGLVFYFTEPTSSTAEVTVDTICNGKPTRTVQILDTDRIHGDRLVFFVLIDDGFRHGLSRLVISMGGIVYTIDNSRAGELYALNPPVRKRTPR